MALESADGETPLVYLPVIHNGKPQRASGNCDYTLWYGVYVPIIGLVLQTFIIV